MNAQQLKNSILQEAIEGRLVPQDPNDEPASVLLDKIRKEKARLVKEGKLKKKDLEETPISEDEIPFKLPEKWLWIRINDLGEIITGGTPSKQNKDYYGDDYPFYKPGDLGKGINIDNSVDRLSQKGYEASRKLKAHSILVTCIGATIGKTGLISKEGACNQQINAIIPVDSLYPKYIYYTICSPSFQSIIRKDAGQTTLPIMNKNNFCKLLFPLPPLAEQKRIVAKIEELLPKVEEYGKAQEALDKLNEELPERLKKSILQEAIEGRLVPQDPNDEPASVLLDKIRAEKKQLVKEGKLKKKDLEETPISEDEIPFKIPESWEWVRIGTLLQLVSDGTHKTPNYVSSGVPFLSVQNISTGKLTMDKIKYITKEEHNILIKRVKPSIGDILVCRIGTLGKALKIYWDFEFSIFVSLGLLRAVDPRLSDYIVFCINSPLGFKWIQENKVGGGTHTYKINLSDLPNMPIPLPPYNEQIRMKRKIEQLMNEIDKLKV